MATQQSYQCQYDMQHSNHISVNMSTLFKGTYVVYKNADI